MPAMSTLTPIRPLLLGLLVTGVLLGCTTTEEPEAATTPGPLAGVPDLNPSQRVDLVTRLKAIDAGLVADEELAVTRSRFVCKRIVAGDGDVALKPYVLEQFVGGPVTGLTDDGVTGIIAATQASFCPRP
jgi:hypothetical protein